MTADLNPADLNPVDLNPVDLAPSRRRVSDTDRQRAGARLREAARTGRLANGELDERLSAAAAARHVDELEALLADLPAPRTLVGGKPGRRRSSLALLGGVSRKGRWVVPADYTAAAVLGGVELDLREASFAERETTVHAYGVMGRVTLVVPPGVEVRSEGHRLFGLFGDRDDPGTPPDAPERPVVVRLTGTAMAGVVDVQVREPEPERRRPVRRLRWWIRLRV